MRKILLTFACGVFLFISCNSDKKEDSAKDNSMSQKNLDASHVVNKAFETGDPSGIDSVVASDFVDHTERGEMNRDSLKAMVKMVHATNKDMKMDIIKELADEEYVFSMMRFRGTSDGSMMPAGPYDMHAIEVVKFKDGKAVEHWEYMEPGEMMKMMEKMPHTEMKKNNIGDTATKKK
ncbi:MAG: SnoaL-like polyketide cyclase [Segetibacter sp.]|nr:SnoaL-like polyketide cyclase [Segetibacter sp.]